MPPQDLGPRFLSALLATAERRRRTALVDAVKPPVTAVVLPDLRSNVLVLERQDVDAATLQQRLDHLVSIPSGGIVHLVLAGGSAADRPLLEAADRNAHNPNRLGVWHLDDGGQLTHVAGRKLALLPEAAKHLPTTAPPPGEHIAAKAERDRREQEETADFASRMQSRRPMATWILCAANIVYFMLSELWGRASSTLEAQLLMGANHRTLVEQGEVWRLLSHAFLHAGGIHLAANLIGLYSLGSFLERLIGWRRFLVLYAASALAGGLASAFLGEPRMSLGASGAVWGLMAAGIALVGPVRHLIPTLLASQMRRQLLPIGLINVGISFLPGIDLRAHFAGGLMGFALLATGILTRGLPGAQTQAPAAPDPLALRIAAGAAVALMAASIAAALITGRPWVPQHLFPADPG